MRFLSSGNSSQMISACLDNISRFQGDNSTVGVGNKTSIGKTVDSDRVDNTSSSSVGNLGSVDIRGVSGDNSTVSMGYQAMGVSSSIGVVSIGENMAKMSKVSSTCSSNSRGVSRYHSSVGESHESSIGDCHAGGKNLNIFTVFIYFKFSLIFLFHRFSFFK